MIELKDGKKFWTLVPGAEARECGFSGLCEPWLGVVHRAVNTLDPKFAIFGFNAKTGITNATDHADVQPDTPLFETEDEANRAYLSLKMAEISADMQDAKDKLGMLMRWMDVHMGDRSGA